MAAKRQETTKAEFSVLKALWRVKQGTVAEVKAKYTELFSTEPAYTTVTTLLTRLVGKGMVKVDKERQPFIYKPAFKEESVLRARLRQFIDTVFDGNTDALVLKLVENEALTSEALLRIEAKIEAKAAAQKGRQ